MTIPRRKRFARAFSMTEVIVAVAIIGLLLAISFPAYHRMKGLARSSHCVGNLRQLGVAISSHVSDLGMRMPEWVAAREDKNEEMPAIDTELRSYLTDEIHFKCPADHAGIYEKTGSSYFWNSALNGQHLSNINFLGLAKNQAGIPLVSDKENFHENVGDEVNVLYVDGHVTRELTFIIDP